MNCALHGVLGDSHDSGMNGLIINAYYFLFHILILHRGADFSDFFGVDDSDLLPI
jgi:hypothetical protein